MGQGVSPLLPLERHRWFEVSWGQAAPATVHTPAAAARTVQRFSPSAVGLGPLRPGGPPRPLRGKTENRPGRKGPPPTPGVPRAVSLLLRERCGTVRQRGRQPSPGELEDECARGGGGAGRSPGEDRPPPGRWAGSGGGLGAPPAPAVPGPQSHAEGLSLSTQNCLALDAAGEKTHPSTVSPVTRLVSASATEPAAPRVGHCPRRSLSG